MPNTKIQNRVAFVTGANRGIGRAIAEALLDRGVKKVYAASRRPDAVADLLATYHDRVVAVELDITNGEQIMQAAASAPDVDLLINNAGVAEHMGTEFTDEAWSDAGRREFEVNTIGTLRVTQAFAPVLARNGGGSVANVASVAGITSFPMFLSYSWSKAALHSLTQGARLLLGAQGTSVHGVYPGPVDTDMAADLQWDKTSPKDVADAILSGIEAGTEEIYPDATSQQLGEIYAGGPKALEQAVAGMISEEPDA